VGQNIIYEPTCGSTNSLAKQYLAQEHLPEGSVIITDHQYQGKGQHGSVWHSEPHKNLTFSLVLYPSFLAAPESFALNIITSLAIYQALSTHVPSGLKIKWPNDIYCQGQKLGGVLIENVIREGKIKASVIGIGLNINQTELSVVSDYGSKTPLSVVCNYGPNPTSLALLLARSFDLPLLLKALLLAIESTYLQAQAQAIAPLEKAYLQHMYRIHERHTFRDATHTFRGKIRGIDGVGRLMVEQEDGTCNHYTAKEVAFL
jgi:BirA family biotin operon repressor/biotin-[acetyl-CoA-carboxylase] ligase